MRKWLETKFSEGRQSLLDMKIRFYGLYLKNLSQKSPYQCEHLSFDNAKKLFSIKVSLKRNYI